MSGRSGLRASICAAVALWLAVHALAFGQLAPIVWLPSLAALLGGIGVMTALLGRHYPHSAFGWCNAVTLMRASLSLSLLTPLLVGAPAGWTVAGIALVALALDGVDGYLARRMGQVSGFGARFDMEVDSVLALLLAVHAAAAGHGGAAVLFMGLARYAFVGASVVLPWLAAPLQPKFRRKAICVLQLGTLIVLQLPLLPDAYALGLALTVSVALAWSFGVDIRWLARHRA